MSARPYTSSTRVKRMRSTETERRPAASLDLWLTRDWSQCLQLETLDEFQELHVCTVNTLYELILINHRGDVRVRGGRYFPDWTPARLAGCTAGGSFLKRLALNVGLQMEFEIEARRIVTSPIQTIAILQKASPAELH